MKMHELVIILLGSVFFWLTLQYVLAQQDQIDCYNWQHEAAVRPGFFLAEWQADQCSYWHIPVAARVEDK